MDIITIDPTPTIVPAYEPIYYSELYQDIDWPSEDHDYAEATA